MKLMLLVKLLIHVLKPLQLDKLLKLQLLLLLLLLLPDSKMAGSGCWLLVQVLKVHIVERHSC